MELYHSSCYLSPPQPLSHSIITFGHPSPTPKLSLIITIVVSHFDIFLCNLLYLLYFFINIAYIEWYHPLCYLPAPLPPSPTPCLTQLLFPEPLPLSVNDIFESALRLVILITFLNLQTNHYIKVFYVCLICLKKSLFMTQYYKNTLSIL